MYLQRQTPAVSSFTRAIFALLGLILSALPAALHAQAVTYVGPPLQFGPAALGSPYGPLPLPFQVPAGITISSDTALTFGNPNADFAITSDSCKGFTGPGTCVVMVKFTPSARGLRLGSLELVTNSASGPTFVPLYGVGLGAQLVFSPDTAAAISTVTPLLPVFYAPSTLVYDGFGNLFFNDTLNNRILEQSSTGTLSKVATLTGNSLQSMAIDGRGVLYITSPTTGNVYTLPIAGGTPTLLPIAGVTLTEPAGIAIDGSGNVYIADASKNTIVRCNPDGSGATTLTLSGLAKPLSNPRGLAVDQTSLYIVDSGNNRVVRVTLANGAAAPITLTGSLPYNPTGIDVDSSGTLYVADTGNRRILRVLPSGAATAVPTPNFSFSAPTGILEADNGDLLSADNTNGLVRVLRSTPTTPLNFTTPTPVGVLDGADGTKFVTLENIGNVPLQLTVPAAGNTDPSTTESSFTVAAASTCPIVTSATAASSARIASAQSCTYGVQFTPDAIGPITGQLLIKSDPNGSGNTVTNAVQLMGIGIVSADSIQLVVTPNPAIAGQPVTLTVTAKLNGAKASSFRGTVTLSSTDAGATFPSGATYTFTAADAGTHTFSPGIIFSQPGQFVVTATSGQFVSPVNVTVQPPLATPAIALGSSANPVFIGNATQLTATVSASSGNIVPTGTVTFYNGSAVIGTAPLGANGVATLPASFSTVGADTITAVYSGDTHFTPATSAPLTENVGDFSLVVDAPASVSVLPGNAAAFTFTLSPVGTSTLAGTVTLSASGLPPGSTVVISPQTVPAGSGSTDIKLTLNVPQNIGSAASHPPAMWRTSATFALLVMMPLALWRKRRRLRSPLLGVLAVLALAAVSTGLSGCFGNVQSGYFGVSPRTYTLTLTATSGSLSHSAKAEVEVQ